MSAPVDVLAVMQASADQLWRYRRDILAREEEEARAAVAELIEAATEVARSPRRGGTIEARQRLHAALARIGGAA